ncbi:DUF5947 family protein [Actinacidiphila glaucinigra]|uniref:DUF5947 family protein n=1 Tax=Actinacidiphila glaucinigra TaxID=235986 RepID=UPI0029A7FEC1|nr:DUF5947 family protein [Streptomyces sp. PA03-3a]
MSPQVPGAGLRRFVAPRQPAPERCELCGVELTGPHRHLVDAGKRALACACVPCALLLERPGAGGGRFAAVPDRVLGDPGSVPDAAAWQRLRIPVSVAFFFHNSVLDRPVVLYPSPAGATESEVDPGTWRSVFGDSPLAGTLRPDVEALLVRRDRDGGNGGGGDGGECYLLPVDRAYELVGRLRLNWQGFDGGSGARAELAAFFDDVRQRAAPVAPREGLPT